VPRSVADLMRSRSRRGCRLEPYAAYRVVANKIPHQLYTLGVIDNLELDAAGPEVILGTAKRAVLTNHDPRDPVKQDGAAAHVARRQRRIQRRAPVVCCSEPPRVLEAIHLGVEHGAAFLHPLVVAASGDPAIEYEDGADRYPAGLETLACLFDSRVEKFIHCCRPDPLARRRCPSRRSFGTRSSHGRRCQSGSQGRRK
jgi:hypothetical protein